MAEAKRPPRSIDQLKDASNRLKQKTQNEDRTGAGRDLVKDLTGMDLHKITQGTLSMQLNVIDRKTMAMMVDTSQMPIADTDVAGCDSPPPGCCCAAVSLLSGHSAGRFCEMQYEFTVAQTIQDAQRTTKQVFEDSYRSGGVEC